MHCHLYHGRNASITETVAAFEKRLIRIGTGARAELNSSFSAGVIGSNVHDPNKLSVSRTTIVLKSPPPPPHTSPAYFTLRRRTTMDEGCDGENDKKLQLFYIGERFRFDEASISVITQCSSTFQTQGALRCFRLCTRNVIDLEPGSYEWAAFAFQYFQILSFKVTADKRKFYGKRKLFFSRIE